MSIDNEKYVSIEYGKWNDYYKPLEETNKHLQRQLDNKDIRVYVHRRYGFGHVGWDMVGGVDINGGVGLNGFDTKRFIGALEDACGYRLVRSNEEEKRIDEVFKAAERINDLPKIVRWLFKIKLP